MLAISKELVSKLGECAHICNDCFMQCLGEDNVKMMVECIGLCKECGKICTHKVGLVYKGAHFKKQQLELCIEACRACAEECEKHDTDHNRECVEACRTCEKACRDFLKEIA